jgi:hypothetical protein
MISRYVLPQAPAEAVFTSTEIELLERAVPDLPLTAQASPLLRNLIKVARLGGYLISPEPAMRLQTIPLCDAACGGSPTFNWHMNSP